MPRFAGIKDNLVYVVSDSQFTHNELQVVEVPSELDYIASKDLITDSKFKDGKIVAKRPKKAAQDLKVALVSNWKMRCGIATYSEFLYTELIKHLGDFKLFIEKNENPISSFYNIGDSEINQEQVIQCWKRGESNLELIKEIKKYDPDVILIQHEFGLWPNAGHWIAMMNQLSSYRVIVTMHSVFHHKDKTICEAAIPEIVVHLDGAKKVLKEEKGIPGSVYVIPHGSFICKDKSKLWNFYKSDHTFMQFGFGFKYKGWEQCIKATAILKQKFKDVFFTGLFSESPFNKVEHQLYYNDLMSLISSLGLEENVGLIRGYQSDTTLDSFLRTNQATVFPYISHPAHEVFGASGAARIAMSKGLPVITSSVNHFSDLPSIKADTPEAIAEELEKLFSSNSLKENQINKQIEYLENTAWEKVAQQYLSVFTG